MGRVLLIKGRLKNMSLVIRLARASIVSIAVLLVLSALVYGGFDHRLDVAAVTAAELLIVGSALIALRSLRAWVHRRQAR